MLITSNRSPVQNSPGYDEPARVVIAGSHIDTSSVVVEPSWTVVTDACGAVPPAPTGWSTGAMTTSRSSRVAATTATVIATTAIAARAEPAASVRDPVCGAVIEPNKAYGSVDHEGQRHYFCCPVCQGAFRQNPNLYLASR